jgi:hypothetical protein
MGLVLFPGKCHRASKRDTGQVVHELPSTPMGLALFPGINAKEN